MSIDAAMGLPLYSFFSEWRQVDANTGHQTVDSKTYMVLVEALSRGVGLLNKDDLFALCQALLLKPHHDADRFRDSFDRYLGVISRAETEPNPVAEQSSASTTAVLPSPDSPQPPEPQGPDSTGGGTKSPTPPEPQPVAPAPTRSTTETINVNVQFATTDENGRLTVGRADKPDWEKEVLKLPYRLNEAYLPVGTRLMRQSIRSLRLADSRHPQLQPDLAATIQRVARRGYYDGPVWTPVYAYHIPLVLVLDQRGSMVPFHGFCAELTAALHQQQPEASVYYVYNAPTSHLFTTPNFTDPLTLWEWKHKHQHDYVLIVSDAGAARGHLSTERVGLTKRFLELGQPMRIAWLNPMPRQRWAGTSAGQIAQWVPMFAATDEEFVTVFRLLKGKIRTDV